MTTIIHIGDITERGLLRRRGEQAYERLSSYLETGDVEVNLDGLRSLSMSFMDGIISMLVDNDQLDKVTFVTDNRVTLEDLSTISGFRNTSIFYRSSDQNERAPVPKEELP